MSRTVFSTVIYGMHCQMAESYDFEELKEQVEAQGLNVESILYRNGYSENEFIVGLRMNSVFDGGFQDFTVLSEQEKKTIETKVLDFVKDKDFKIKTRELKYYSTLCNI